ncbi:MAG: SDR family NAD(P)-dependent oxidoreductase [Gemmataceae bacterium]
MTEVRSNSSFHGCVALVTGASSGIGRATALELAERGCDVAMNFFSMKVEAEETAAAIRALGRKAWLYPVDVSQPDAVQGMVDNLMQQTGRLDYFVSSAVYSDREPFHTAKLEGFRKTIDVSLMGAYYGLRSATNAILKGGRGGAMVIVSSPHAQIAFPNCMAYNIAKAGLDQMARTAAVELLPHKIRVNTIYPGWTDTPGERKFMEDSSIKQAAAGLPWGRLASPEEIARAICHLLDSHQTDYMTGSIIHMDGGLFLPWWSNRGADGKF